MKFLFALFILLAGNTALLKAQAPNRVLLMDGKILLNSPADNGTDTIRIKKARLKKAKTFVISFENHPRSIWKRVTWLQNENKKSRETNTYNLPAPNGTVTIPATVLRNLSIRKKVVEIWTSLQPANDMLMVREQTELIYKIVID